MKLSESERIARNDVIRRFKRALATRSAEESSHATRVAVYSAALGAKLKLSNDELLILRYAAELHDLGKLSFPDRLFELNTRSREDWPTIRNHPQEAIGRVSSFDWITPAQDSIRHHHEWFDGSGYPSGLSAADIPLGARIIAVSEAFDAMTMPCGWRSNIPEQTALDELQRGSGSQFDPEVVHAFLKIQLVVQPVGL